MNPTRNVRAHASLVAARSETESRSARLCMTGSMKRAQSKRWAQAIKPLQYFPWRPRPQATQGARSSAMSGALSEALLLGTGRSELDRSS